MTGRVGPPPVAVDIAWGATVKQWRRGDLAEAAWHEVASVRGDVGVAFSRGRTSVEDQVAAGQLQATINTRQLAASLPPGFTWPTARRIKTPIRVRHTGTGAILWVGSVADWGGSWTNGVRPATTITATDMVARLAARKLRAVPVMAALHGEHPDSSAAVFCYPLDDDAAAETCADIVAAADRWRPADAAWFVLDESRLDEGVVAPDDDITLDDTAERLAVAATGTGGTITFAGGYSPGSPAAAAESGVATMQPADASNWSRLTARIPNLGRGTDSPGWTVHCMVLFNSVSPVTPASVLRVEDSATRVGVDVIRDGGDVKARIRDPGTTTTAASQTVVATGSASDDDWCHVAVAVDRTAGTGDWTVTLLINGAAAGTSASQTVLRFGSGPWTLTIGDGAAASVANVTGHRARLSDSDLAVIAASRLGYAGDRPTTRAARLAVFAGWPASIDPDSEWSMTMAPQATKDTSAADALAGCADTELTPWWVAADGTIRLRTRENRAGPASSFTVAASAVDPGTTFTTSDAHMCNTATAVLANGDTVEKRNPASADDFEEYARSINLHTESTSDAETVLAAVVAMGGQQITMTSTLTTDLHVQAAGISDPAAAVAADVGDCFTVSGIPDHLEGLTYVDGGTYAYGAHAAYGGDLLVCIEGVADVITVNSWRRTWTVSPIDTDVVFSLDVDDLDGPAVLAL